MGLWVAVREALVSTSKQRLRVMIVEDSEADADMLRRLLIGAFDVQVTRSKTELLEATRTRDPDVILLDLRLPDGDDAISLVMKLVARYRSSAIIVVTGLDDESLALDTLRAGAQDYLVKEIFVRDQMVRKIRHAHARKLATVHEVEAAVSSASMSGGALVDADLLGKKIETLLAQVIEDKFSKANLRQRSDVYEMLPTPYSRLLRLTKANWKFVSGVLAAAGVYFADFRQTVVDTASSVEVQANIVEQQQRQIDELQRASIKNLVTTVKTMEHLEKVIDTVARDSSSSKITPLPEPPPEVRAIQGEVSKIEAQAELFPPEPK